jgi:uncharacterized protein YcbK (DUF882 family)
VLAAVGVVALGITLPNADKLNLVSPADAAPAMSHSVASAGSPAARAADSTAVTFDSALAEAPAKAELVPDALLGTSGMLRAAIKDGVRPGILQAAVTIGKMFDPISDFSFITPRPGSEARRGRMGAYYLGKWPSSRSAKGGQVSYIAPKSFIEVTPANENTKLSEHFRLRDFLTHDQVDVWPKYVAVNLKLVDKLELVLEDLKAHGVDPSGVHVMSGFRTPRYNARGGDPRGRAMLSRHMYGDAADIYIDRDGVGHMSDLNGDGRVDINDSRVILEAVNRVEQAHPSLIGGAGVYAGTSAHGPFIHIDTRGYPARWVGTGE